MEALANKEQEKQMEHMMKHDKGLRLQVQMEDLNLKRLQLEKKANMIGQEVGRRGAEEAVNRIGDVYDPKVNPD